MRQAMINQQQQRAAQSQAQQETALLKQRGDDLMAQWNALNDSGTLSKVGQERRDALTQNMARLMANPEGNFTQNQLLTKRIEEAQRSISEFSRPDHMMTPVEVAQQEEFTSQAENRRKERDAMRAYLIKQGDDDDDAGGWVPRYLASESERTEGDNRQTVDEVLDAYLPEVNPQEQVDPEARRAEINRRAASTMRIRAGGELSSGDIERIERNVGANPGARGVAPARRPEMITIDGMQVRSTPRTQEIKRMEDWVSAQQQRAMKGEKLTDEEKAKVGEVTDYINDWKASVR
jgi:hypothetical protein